MSDQTQLEHYQHFIESYYPLPMSWLSLEEATMEYKKVESSNRVRGLAENLNEIKELGDWEFIKAFSYKHGLFDYPVEQLKEMVNIMLRALSE